MAVLTIAKDSLREMSKRKLILAIIIAGILTALLFVISTGFIGIIVKKWAGNQSGGMEQFLTNEGYKFLVTLFSLTIDFIGTLLTLLIFSSFLPTEIDRGTIKLLISKPVSRLEIIIGKFTGGLFLMFGYSIFMGILQIIASLFITGKIEPQECYGSFLLFFKFLMLGAVSMALSVIMRPVLASVIAFFVSGDFFLFASMLFSEKIIKYSLISMYYILPVYSIFGTRTMSNLLFSAPPMTTIDIFYKIAYALDFILIILGITIVMFNKKDLIQ